MASIRSLSPGSEQRNPALSYGGGMIAVEDSNLGGKRVSYDKPSVAVYRRDGTLVQIFPGMVSPAWTRQGALLMAGIDTPEVRLYLADDALQRAYAVQMKGINGAIASVATNPANDRIAFVFNGQLWELAPTLGGARRLVAFPEPIAEIAFSSDGRQIAFLAANPERQKTRAGGKYPLQILDGKEIHQIWLDGLPGGPLSWTAR